MILRRAPTIMLGLLVFFFVLSVDGTPYVPLNRALVQLRGYMYAATRTVSRFRALWVPGREWERLSGDRTTVFFSEAETTQMGPRAVLAATTSALDEVARDLDVAPQNIPPVAVIVHPDRSSLRKVFGWSASQSASGVYWGGVIRVLSPEVWLDDADQNDLVREYALQGPMVHELTHLMLDFKTNGNYEAWFSEGLAQWEERRLIDWEWTDGEEELRRQPLPLKLLRSDFFHINDEALAYRESLRMVDFIVSRAGEDGLHEIIDLLAVGYNMDEALMKVLGYTPSTLEAEFYDWLAS